MRPSYARRVDKNQQAIVAELRAHGVRVTSLAAVGKGVPDLVCSYGSAIKLVELKRPHALTRKTDGAPKRLNRNESATRARQLAWAANHEGHVITATTAEEVLAALGLDPRPDTP